MCSSVSMIHFKKCRFIDVMCVMQLCNAVLSVIDNCLFIVNIE